jgi:uncharacterized damage-inducible protein DinB
MPVQLNLTDLMDYTEWEREKWRSLLRQRAEALSIGTGPNGDGRFATVHDVVKHVFSAELRYVERLSGAPLTDTAAIATEDADALFRFGERSRAALRQFVERLPADGWDAMLEFPLMNSVVRATPRKVVTHVLLHETRHWAQLATLLRLHGVTDGFHDFLLSPILGGGIERVAAKP